MQATGKIIAILEPRSGVSQAGNPWYTQQFVLQTEEQYPKKIPFEVSGEERVKNFNIQMDKVVTIDFDIDAREWNGKWIPSIRCFKVTRSENQEGQRQPAPQSAPTVQAQEKSLFPKEGVGDNDNLPF